MHGQHLSVFFSAPDRHFHEMNRTFNEVNCYAEEIGYSGVIYFQEITETLTVDKDKSLYAIEVKMSIPFYIKLYFLVLALPDGYISVANPPEKETPTKKQLTMPFGCLQLVLIMYR